ncbi:Sec-independent protein translocase protein TatB [Pseudomonas sp. NPDC008258]|uniref:Sec-independent protein translocase protein TatB n=1 Tax=Pseudomonas sp. NPDC008258 TaxID=3364418 RepID=UPI0036E12ECD
MFGISFSELLLVGLIALLVLGPERLPGAARTAGLWVGRLKRSLNSIKLEVEREIDADHIRRPPAAATPAPPLESSEPPKPPRAP